MNYSSYLENFLLMIRFKVVEGDKQASLSRFQQSAPPLSADVWRISILYSLQIEEHNANSYKYYISNTGNNRHKFLDHENTLSLDL